MFERLAWFGLACSLAACTASKSQGGDTDSTVSCGTQAPAFDNYTITDADTAEFPSGTKRVIQLLASATDADGDLYAYTVEVWFDGFLDGKLSDKPEATIEGEINHDGACNVTAAEVGAFLPIGSSKLPFGEKMEFGFRILDAAGHASSAEPAFMTFTIPSE